MAELSGQSNKVVKPWQRYEADNEMSWNQSLVKGAQNLPRSTVKAGGEILEAVMNPIETGHTILKLMQGGFHLVLPDEIQQKFDPEGKTEESQQMAVAVGQFFADKYGSEESIKHVVATDPASVLMDIASILSVGGGALVKSGQLTNTAKLGAKDYAPNLVEKTGEALQTASTMTDPLTATLKTGNKIIGGTALATREIAGAMSGTGGSAVGNVYDSARVGAEEGSFLSRGNEGQRLTGAMRGATDLDGVLQAALRDLDVMQANKQANYRADKKLWASDNTTLHFKGIDSALEKAKKIVNYEGTVINAAGAKALDDARAIIDEWKTLDARKFHTVEGMDKLKQKLWSVVENTPVENATAKGVAQNIYHSVKNTIADQAPNYARAMKEYSDALDTIKEIKRTLSLDPKKSSVDTAIRKLQSIMRDNVNTNYGQRMKLARQLEDVGGEKFIAELAGQQFSSAMPRGINQAVLPAMAATAVASGGGSLPGAAATLAMGSPRIVGEGANLTGYIMGKLDKLPVPSYEGINGLLQILYQTQAQMENKQNQ